MIEAPFPQAEVRLTQGDPPTGKGPASRFSRMMPLENVLKEPTPS